MERDIFTLYRWIRRSKQQNGGRPMMKINFCMILWLPFQSVSTIQGTERGISKIDWPQRKLQTSSKFHNNYMVRFPIWIAIMAKQMFITKKTRAFLNIRLFILIWQKYNLWDTIMLMNKFRSSFFVYHFALYSHPI